VLLVQGTNSALFKGTLFNSHPVNVLPTVLACALLNSGNLYYRLKPEPFQQVDAWLAQFRRFWSAHVDALERHLDRMDPSTPTKRKTKEKTTRPKPRP
jgi:hypothetical protein